MPGLGVGREYDTLKEPIGTVRRQEYEEPHGRVENCQGKAVGVTLGRRHEAQTKERMTHADHPVA
jgi:hypothetical protein